MAARRVAQAVAAIVADIVAVAAIVAVQALALGPAAVFPVIAAIVATVFVASLVAADLIIGAAAAVVAMVVAPVLGEFYCRPRRVAAVLAELVLKTFEQGKRIGGPAGELRQHLAVVKQTHLLGIGFHHRVTHGDLAVAAELDPPEAAVLDAARELLAVWMFDEGERFAVVHGDYRLDNLLFDDGRGTVAVVDWQMAAHGPALGDVAYFVGAGLLPDDRRAHERDLVATYHRALDAHGVTGYGADDCWGDYVDGTLHEQDLADGIGGIVDLMAEVRPDTVVTFGPDGITGHADHRREGAGHGLAGAGDGPQPG